LASSARFLSNARYRSCASFIRVRRRPRPLLERMQTYTARRTWRRRTRDAPAPSESGSPRARPTLAIGFQSSDDCRHPHDARELRIGPINSASFRLYPVTALRNPIGRQCVNHTATGRTTKHPLLGTWRTSRRNCGRRRSRLDGSGAPDAGAQGHGRLGLLAIEADLDYRVVQREGLPAVEFSSRDLMKVIGSRGVAGRSRWRTASRSTLLPSRRRLWVTASRTLGGSTRRRARR